MPGSRRGAGRATGDSSPPSTKTNRTRCGSDRSPWAEPGSWRCARAYVWPGVAAPPRDVRAITAAPRGRCGSAPPRPRGAYAAHSVPFDRPKGLPATRRLPSWTTPAERLDDVQQGVRAARTDDLDAFADGRLAVLPSRLFGASDGMTSAECMLAGPGAVRLADGTVWFSTTAGVVRIDPAQLQHNALAPRSSSKA